MRAKADKTRGNRKGSSPVIRREEAAEHASHGGAWKVAYADFVTAMMAFFLLMWLMNATTEDQRKGLADYFSPTNLMSHNSSGTGQPFGGHTAFDNGAMLSDRGAVQITVGSRPVLDNVEDDSNEPGTSPRAGSDQPPDQPGQPAPTQPRPDVAAPASAAPPGAHSRPIAQSRKRRHRPTNPLIRLMPRSAPSRRNVHLIRRPSRSATRFATIPRSPASPSISRSMSRRRGCGSSFSTRRTRQCLPWVRRPRTRPREC
jgi:hypothetical protein